MRNKGKHRTIRRTFHKRSPKALVSSLSNGAAPAAGGLPSVSFGEIGSFIDRMGGIQGIIETFTKIRSAVSSFRQFAPMLKGIVGALSSLKDAPKQQTNFSEADDPALDADFIPPPPVAKRNVRQRKPRRKQAGAGAARRRR